MGDLVLSGGTSGTITVTPTAVAGSNTLTLPAATGTILTTASSGQIIPKAALPTGSVLQVVSATYSTATSNSTTTYADTGLTASITPTSSTSKILVLVNQNGLDKSTGSSGNSIFCRLVRGSTTLIQIGDYINYTDSALRLITGSLSTSYLDSPATTSSTTYKTQFMNISGAASVTVQSQGVTSTIILLEIAA